MEAARRGGLLYPMLVIAAIAVIVFSVTGIATMMGWLPGALSQRDSALSPRESTVRLEQPAPRGEIDGPRTAPGVPAADVSRSAADAQAVAPSPVLCAHCGVIESIRPVEVQGQSSWLGAAGGAVVGGLLGNQIGSGRGRTAATVVGAGAGAYGGSEIEKHVKTSVRYRVRVRMEDGTHRTFNEAKQPAYAVGQTVRVTDRGIRPAG
jgi:outer membrane lipoprotein SlyB